MILGLETGIVPHSEWCCPASIQIEWASQTSREQSLCPFYISILTHLEYGIRRADNPWCPNGYLMALWRRDLIAKYNHTL